MQHMKLSQAEITFVNEEHDATLHREDSVLRFY